MSFKEIKEQYLKKRTKNEVIFYAQEGDESTRVPIPRLYESFEDWRSVFRPFQVYMEQEEVILGLEERSEDEPFDLPHRWRSAEQRPYNMWSDSFLYTIRTVELLAEACTYFSGKECEELELTMSPWRMERKYKQIPKNNFHALKWRRLVKLMQLFEKKGYSVGQGSDEFFCSQTQKINKKEHDKCDIRLSHRFHLDSGGTHNFSQRLITSSEEWYKREQVLAAIDIEWQRGNKPSLMVDRSMMNINSEQTVQNSYPVKLDREDVETNLCIYVSEGIVYYPLGRARPASYSWDGNYQHCDIHISGIMGLGTQRDFKRVVNVPMVPHPTYNAHFHELFHKSITEEQRNRIFVVDKDEDKWTMGNRVSHRLFFSISQRQVEKFLIREQEVVEWERATRGPPIFPFFFDDGEQSRRVSAVFKIVMATAKFQFVDVEGSKSDKAVGVLNMDASNIFKSYCRFSENAPVGTTLFVKGGKLEREKYPGKVIVDLDVLIPWTPEPDSLHSPFGGVFQMAFRIFCLKAGCYSTPFHYEPRVATIAGSQIGAFSTAEFSFAMSDVVQIQWHALRS